MSLRRLLMGSALVLGFATAGQAQTTLNFDDLGSCTGTPLSTYAGWISVASGVTCQTGDYSWLLHPSSGTNYMKSSGSMDWTFNGGPVVFDGMWASGYGSYFVELLNGGTTVSTTYFSSYGGLVHVTPGYAGQVDRVKIHFLGGLNFLGIDDVSFTSTYDPAGELVNEPNSAPEPATLFLVASGLSGIGAMVRRRRNRGTQ